jgi:hypothetical protein
MGRKKTKRGSRLRTVAAGLAAVAAAFTPTARAAPPPSLPQAVEADSRAAARLAQAETALAQGLAGVDRATLGVFACDCAARVAPLYERFGGSVGPLERARARAAAAAAGTASGSPAAAAPSPAGAFGAAYDHVERNVAALEQEVANEAAVTGSAKGALRRLVFARSEQLVSRLDDGAADGAPADEPPFRMLAVALAAAEAIDEALLVAAGGSPSRVGPMCEAIAEAIYLDHVFRRGDEDAALNAVFRELAWQRRHLRALRTNV